MNDQLQLPNLPDDHELGWRASRVLDSFDGDAMRVAMAYTHMQTLYEASQRALSQVISENTAHAEEGKRLTAALEQISQSKQCDGPDCYYCDSDLPHPSTRDALTAQNALDSVNGKN